MGGCTAPTDSFPKANPEDAAITLQRTACFGSCPDYTVTIDGEGHVAFRTRAAEGPSAAGAATVHREFSIDDGVLFSGNHTAQIDPELVRALIERFQKANFFELQDEYAAPVTDMPTYVLTIHDGARTKTVVDYFGKDIGMPARVTELQDAVDQAAGSDRWVDGADGLVEWLETQGFDFTSKAARRLALEGALGNADDATIVGLLERGADSAAQVPHPFRRYTQEVVLGEALLDASVEQGRARVFSYLAEGGWAARADKSRLEALFADSAGGCSAALVRAFAERGLGVDIPAEEGKSALANLAGTYRCDYDEGQRVETARALLDLGADPNRRDVHGETAVYDVEYAPLLDLLYARGARADIIDKKGNSPALSSWNDAIVLRHLQQGARPVGTYYDGRTLTEQMKQRPMPQVKAWLAANAARSGARSE